MSVLKYSPRKRVALILLAAALASALAFAGVTLSQSPSPDVLRTAPAERLADHRISLAPPPEDTAPALSINDAEKALVGFLQVERVALKEQRLVLFTEDRGAELGGVTQRLAWAFSIDAVPPFSGGPSPGKDGTSCWRPADAITTKNSYFLVFVDAGTGEVLAAVAGGLQPFPTPVCG